MTPWAVASSLEMPTVPQTHDRPQADVSPDVSLDVRQLRLGLAGNAVRTPGKAHPRRRAFGKASAPAADRSAETAGAIPLRPRSRVTVALTKFQPELLEAVDRPDRARAGRALLASGYRFRPGPVDLAAGGWPESTFALLVLRGSLVHQTTAVSGRMIAFLSAGDLLMPFSPDPYELPGRVSVTATEDVLLAALDQGFIRAAAVWPKLMIVIQQRLSEQHHRLALHGAICQLPRVEQRLMALMWHLAERFGKVTADGIIITQPLNHQTLGYLIGARRPTVTLALKALRERDYLHRRADGIWLLHNRRSACHSLEDLIEELKVTTSPDAIRPGRSAAASAGPVAAASGR